VDNATTVLWKLLLNRGAKFRCLNALDLPAEVWKGTRLVNGIHISDHLKETTA